MSLFTKGVMTAFYEAYDAAAPIYTEIATVVNSTAAGEDYAWLGSLPRMREMNGERIPKKLLAYTYTLVNKEFEASIEVKQTDIDDDQTGKYLPLARSIGEQARLYPDELVLGTLLPGGFTGLAYDGQYFFDTDHASGASGSQSNKGTTALSAASYEAAVAALRGYLDDNARPMNQRLDLRLVVPPALEGTAKQIIEATTLSGGGVNTNAGTAKLIVTPWLTDVTNWYLLNVAGTIKPFIVQVRDFIPFESLEEGSHTNFMRKVNYYGTYWRGNAGYGLWQKAYGALVAG